MTDKKSKEIYAVLECMAYPGCEAIGMTGKQIEEMFRIKFVHTHEDYSKMTDVNGNLDETRIITDKEYVIKPFDYVEVEGNYGKIARVGIRLFTVREKNVRHNWL